MVASEIIEGLRSCELFALLSQKEVQILTTALATACEMKAYQAGESIFEQGEHSAWLYVIVDGQVLLRRSVDIGERAAIWPLGLLGKGRAMGWSSVLYGPRTATASAVCQKPTRVVVIEGTSLRSVLEQQPQIGVKVMERLACMLGERLRTAYNTMEAHL